MITECQVNLEYDDEAKVWLATSKDIVGLVLESESLDKLIGKVLNATPELVELNNLPKFSIIHFLLTGGEKNATMKQLNAN